MTQRRRDPHPVLDVDEIDVEQLSPRLREFVDLIGLAATMQLVHAFGGRRLYVPLNPSPDHYLAALIGLDALRKLSRVYGIEVHFLIPKADKALRALRSRRIRSEYGPKSVGMLSEEYGLSERRIWQIVSEPAQEPLAVRVRAVDNQPRLFD